MPDPNDIWSVALQEAYASNPDDEIVLATLELRHPMFLDEDGNVTAVRIVSDTGVDLVGILDQDGNTAKGHLLTLEASAPMDPSGTVPFISCMFEVQLPGEPDNRIPELQISIDNAMRLLVPHLDNAIASRAAVEITYREFIFSDTSEPSFILGGAKINSAESSMLRVVATAGFTDLINKMFPGKIYTTDDYPGLQP